MVGEAGEEEYKVEGERGRGKRMGNPKLIYESSFVAVVTKLEFLHVHCSCKVIGEKANGGIGCGGDYGLRGR
jgi:hypothetical protein